MYTPSKTVARATASGVASSISGGGGGAYSYIRNQQTLKTINFKRNQ